MLGYLDMVKFLHHNTREDENLTIPNILDTVVREGHLQILKFFHEERKERCTNLAIISAAAEKDYLPIIEFLFNNGHETYISTMTLKMLLKISY